VAYSGSSTPRFGADSGSTLRLLSYLALAVVLMVSDHRGGVLNKVRRTATVAVEPLWWLASLPARAIRFVDEAVSDQTRLNRDNTALQRQHLVDEARIVRMQAVAEENQRLRALLGGTRGNRLNVQLASILDIDLDPVRQQVVLDVGASQGVHAGQAVIDAGGVLGQVATVTPTRATVLLITDPDHAAPVQIVRSGVRMIAYGTGRSDRLVAPNIPLSSDLKVGDELVTSGIGGRFPAGFPVGTVTALSPDTNHAFVEASIAPAARLDRSGEVLLVWNLPDTDEAIGPPVPQDLATRRANAVLAQRAAEANAAHPVGVATPSNAPPPAPPASSSSSQGPHR
jgi:rod shape-determining protein MreC